jgi:glycosyltransferase involved in cell wall biosynthesis
MADALTARGHEVRCVWAADLGGTRAIDRHLFGWRLSRLLVSTAPQPEVAIIHEPSAAASCVRALFHRRSPKIAVMSHGVESRILRDLEKAAMLGFSDVGLGARLRHTLLWGWQERLAFRLARHAFCLATVDADYLLRVVGVPPGRLTIFANGTDPTDEWVDVQAGSDVLFLGSWMPEKGARVLPRVWRRVREQCPDARLVLAGTGRERDRVVAGFEPQDRTSISVIPQFRSLEEIWPVVQRCALFVLPSLREGSPLALLEAMVRGLPPVAAGVGGVPELIAHEREGYVYDPLDVEAASRFIVKLLSNPEHRSVIGSAARERALRSTWALAAEAVERGCAAAISRSPDACLDTLRAVDARTRSSRDSNIRRGA